MKVLVIFHYDDISGGVPGTSGIVRIPDAATVHIRLDKKYFEPETLLAILRKILCKKGTERL